MLACVLAAAAWAGGPARTGAPARRAPVRATVTVDAAVLAANDALHAAACERSDARYRPSAPLVAYAGEWERFCFPASPEAYAGVDAVPPCPFTAVDLACVSTRPLLSAEQCAVFLADAQDVAASAWDLPAAAAGAEATYARRAGTTVEVSQLPRGRELFNAAVLPALFPAVVAAFPDALGDVPPARLRVQAAFVVKYNASAGQTELGYHRDGPLVTATCALNCPSEFDGGGTLIEAKDWPRSPAPIRLARGHALLHPGNVRHGGAPITSGLRFVLVVFMYDSRTTDHARHCTVRAQARLDGALREQRGSAQRRAALAAAARGFHDALACGAGDRSEAAHVGLGHAFLELASYDGAAALAAALDNLEAAVVRAPADAHAHTMLSTACLAAGLTARALEAASAAVEADPASPIARNNRGLILAALGRSADALRAYADGLRLDPSNAELLVNFGVSAYDLGETATAVRCFRAALDSDPTHARAATNLAQLQLGGA
ncbi:hypothetical protein KFE25_003072 [Diacronema lutheri]|uniref:Fe2OG dioxygenase domain-containing protein n=1 Tax=Diacronema lutheri TaxID=2081491 RepID=A0A8J5XDA7_DIALT|nr:hypothetical protein KFE25_003072 [Diacronema lutheri]